MIRDFIWKGNSEKGIHLVGWQTINRPKTHGGHAVRRAREANTVMLGKLVWDLQNHPNKLWINVLHSKYITAGNFLNGPKVQGSFTWNSIHNFPLRLKLTFSPWLPCSVPVCKTVLCGKVAWMETILQVLDISEVAS